MLSSTTVSIIKQTVPLLSQHSLAITQHFYPLMFNRYPQVRAFFNTAHQQSGQQAFALANAVVAYAQNIDNLSALEGAVEVITHKHASLGIEAEHYDIVGECLLAAIQDVLGDAATPDVIQAWAEAYTFLADILKAKETQLYQQAAKQPGGWEGYRRFTLTEKHPESAIITSFYLVPEDKKPLAAYQPGQYLTVRLHHPEHGEQIRNYSLSDAPGKSYYRISVKKEGGAAGTPYGVVSSYLHDHLTLGDSIDVRAPMGEFVLDSASDAPVVLLSGGVGLTPVTSMLNTLTRDQPEREVIFIHAAQNGRYHAMRHHVNTLTQIHPKLTSYTLYSEPDTTDQPGLHYDTPGFVTDEVLDRLSPSQDSQYYFCGPKPFMQSVYHILKGRGVADHNIRYEFFGPAQSLTDTSSSEPARGPALQGGEG